MRYPKMQTQPRTTVTVPQLNGGVNLNDLPNHVNDNQLTACNNVWWHDGALQTRPGLAKVQRVMDAYNRRQQISELETMFMNYEDIGYDAAAFSAALIKADGTVDPLGTNSRYVFTNIGEPLYQAFCCRAPKSKDYDWLFFFDHGDILSFSETGGWSLATQEAYVPLIMINGRGNNAPGGSDAVTPEAFNLLTDVARCTFTTDGVSTVYELPVNGTPTRARLTVSDGTNIRTVETEFDSTYNLGAFRGLTKAELGLTDEEEETIDVMIQVLGTQVVCWRNTSDNTFILPEAYTEAANNLEIFLSCEVDGHESRTITRMTKAVWFGGVQSGLSNGAHLFVTGNPDKPNLLHWSDVNKPLYFPENNLAYVGEESSSITALAKQGELLVIFKEHDIYCAQYVESDVPTVEDLEKGVVTEITLHKAYFTVTQLHPNIGCDCPDTIRLVNNKLVWLTSDGRVHILTGANQYSERNVRQASPLIEKELKKHSKEEMQAAVAGEYEGYYVLLIGNRMYLLDCQTSAFNSFQHYSREETAQKALPWYIWTLPEGNYTCLASTTRSLVLVTDEGLDDGDIWNGTVYRLEGDTDDGAAIESSFTTKQYDFARVDTKKSIDQVYISVGDVEGCRIRVGYVTDRYTVEDAYVIECTGETDGSVQPYRVTPNARLVQRFGLTLSAENPMTVSGLTIKYKNQGVVR